MKPAVALLTLLACIAGALALLAAAHIGQQSRCDWLVAHNSPTARTYDCTGTGPR